MNQELNIKLKELYELRAGLSAISVIHDNVRGESAKLEKINDKLSNLKKELNAYSQDEQALIAEYEAEVDNIKNKIENNKRSFCSNENKRITLIKQSRKKHAVWLALLFVSLCVSACSIFIMVKWATENPLLLTAGLMGIAGGAYLFFVCIRKVKKLKMKTKGKLYYIHDKKLELKIEEKELIALLQDKEKSIKVLISTAKNKFSRNKQKLLEEISVYKIKRTKQVEELNKQILNFDAIYNALKNKKTANLNEQDWEKLDLVIFRYLTDDVKESSVSVISQTIINGLSVIKNNHIEIENFNLPFPNTTLQEMLFQKIDLSSKELSSQAQYLKNISY